MLEKATISFDCTRNPVFKIAADKGKIIIPKVAPGDGYSIELAHFIKAVNGKSVPDIINPQDSLNSVKIILAEKKSCDTLRKVSLK
ncbi:MAG: hypothetical protein BWY69_00915 [Planctomycetes bacterium ADurb.Bin401]|nr:MAG: hypothetical protein BWY69_00915 [Planctomycetes bacterium ADurb.Bin401]